MDEREMQELLQRAMEEIRTLGAVSDETARKLKEAADETSAFKKAMKGATADVVKGMGRLTMSLANGNQEFTQFNVVVDSVANAISKMGQSIPFLGAALVATAEGAKFLLGQLQTTVTAFNKVSESGLIGADGMTGLRNQAIESGVSLDIFSRAIANNSEALARFGGTAADGSQKFSRALGQVNRTFGDQLMRLGMSFDSIAESTAGYIALQTRLGNSQRMTQDQLAKGAFEYAKQMDELAKLTGQQKADLQKQRDAILSEARFRAKIQELESQGRGDLARSYEQLTLMLPELGPGLRDLIASGGVATTEAAREISFATDFAAQRMIQAMESGIFQNPQQVAMELQAGSRQFVSNYQGLVKFTGDLPGFVSNFGKVADLAGREFGAVGRAAGIAATQMGAPDALTEATVKAQKAMMNFTIAMDEVTIKLLPNAGQAVASFADGMNKILREITKQTGISVQPLPRYADGGITQGPSLAGEAGPEAVVPLPDGRAIPVVINLSDPRQTGPTFAGYNEYRGYNSGPMGTDLSVLKTIAEKLGAYDSQANVITDPATWKQILQTGVATSYDTGLARVGLGESTEVTGMVADRIAELTGGGMDITESIKQTMTESMDRMVATLRGEGGEQQILVPELRRMVALMERQNATSEKILQSANN